MTTEFVEAVNHYCDGLVVAVGCHGIECEYAEGDEEHQCEPGFSWSQCDSCGSRLGGDRDKATGIPIGAGADADKYISMSICVDCTLYHANGDLPETWE